MPEQWAYRFMVVVDCENREQAEQVMRERMGHDEDYGFDYAIDYDFISRDKQ